MNVRHHPSVAGEVTEAVRWYEERSSGLGDEFFESLQNHIAIIAKRPRSFGFWLNSRRVRRMKMHRFPFDILFRILPDRIRILCVRHHKRHPSYGMHRR